MSSKCFPSNVNLFMGSFEEHPIYLLILRFSNFLDTLMMSF